MHTNSATLAMLMPVRHPELAGIAGLAQALMNLPSRILHDAVVGAVAVGDEESPIGAVTTRPVTGMALVVAGDAGSPGVINSCPRG